MRHLLQLKNMGDLHNFDMVKIYSYLNIISYIYFTILPNDGCSTEDKSRDNILSLNASERNSVIYNFIDNICKWKKKGKMYCDALITFSLFVYACGQQNNIPVETLIDFRKLIRL